MKLSSREILLYLTLKYGGDWDQIYKAIRHREDIDYKDAEKVVGEYSGKYVTLIDKEYPELLKRTIRPPFVLLIK